MKTSLPILALVLGIAASSQAVTLTHSASNAIVTNNSVSCNSGGITRENSYYRTFNLSDFGLSGAVSITSAMFGVEAATGAASASQSITVNLYDGYTVAGSALSVTGSLVGTSTLLIADGSSYLQTVPISGVVTTGRLVMEVFSANAGNKFFIGSNAAGQTAPGYIRAPACGVTSPTSLSGIGFPGMHMVMSVEAQPVPEPASMAALGLGVAALIRRRRKA